jgi:2-polyprenyl-6-methoxyphenol hydroxylase-like FAD-dependent oxidoreductase
MTGIGIVGSGVAGPHLGLLLQSHDVPVTIYTDRTDSGLERGFTGFSRNVRETRNSALARARRAGIGSRPTQRSQP